MIKTIPGYFKKYDLDILNEDGSFSHSEKRVEWVDQVDITLNPLEEMAIQAYWDYGDSLKLMPEKPSIAEEHEWIITEGTPYVLQKRSEFKKIESSMQNSVDIKRAQKDSADKAWVDHIDYCVSNDLDPNVYNPTKK